MLHPRGPVFEPHIHLQVQSERAILYSQLTAGELGISCGQAILRDTHPINIARLKADRMSL